MSDARKLLDSMPDFNRVDVPFDPTLFTAAMIVHGMHKSPTKKRTFYIDDDFCTDLPMLIEVLMSKGLLGVTETRHGGGIPCNTCKLVVEKK